MFQLLLVKNNYVYHLRSVISLFLTFLSFIVLKISSSLIPNIQNIFRINISIIQTRLYIEAVNLRVQFKVIFRQNEIQYFTTDIRTL